MLQIQKVKYRSFDKYLYYLVVHFLNYTRNNIIPRQFKDTIFIAGILFSLIKPDAFNLNI